MIINNLLFVINSKLEFVDGTTQYGYLTANDINKDMLYVISPFPYSTDVRATFKNYEQGEEGETIFFKKSKKKIEDLIDKDNKTTPYELVKDWNVLQSIMPNKALTYVAGNRGGNIEVSFSFREHLPPSIPNGLEYQGEIYSLDNIGGYGAYLVKTNLLELDQDVFANYNDLIIYEGTFSVIRANIQKGGTAPITYEVDPNIKDEDYEIIEFDLVSSLISMVGDVADDVQGLDNEINNILNKNIEQDGRLDINEAELIRLDGRLIVVEDNVSQLEIRKQDKLIAGENITIDPNTNVISSSGGSGGGNSYEPDGVTIVLNEDDELEVSTAILDDIESRVSKNEFETFKISNNHKINAVENGLQIQIDEMDFVVDITLVGNDIKVEHRDGDITYIPVNEAVESGYYDTNTKELVLELANGNEIRIPAGDIVAGLASVDYVDTGLALKENKSNKITKLVGVPNNTQYMSAKLTNDLIMAARTEINSMLDNKVDKNADITAGTHPKITYDAKGLVTGGGALVAGDIPNLAPTKITQNASNRFVTDIEKAYWDGKQDELVAGTNITIVDNVISSSGDVGGTVDWEDVENKPELYNVDEIQYILDDATQWVEGALLFLDEGKQSKLVAGDNITIDDYIDYSVISASGDYYKKSETYSKTEIDNKDTATQTALNLKADKTQLNNYVTTSTFDMQMLEKLEIKPNGTDLLIIGGKINPLYIDDTSYKVNHPTANSQAAMLALDVPAGTVVVRLDTPSKELFLLTQLPASTLANWQVVSSNTVVSVAGKTGVIVLGITDISGLTNALNLKLDITTFESQLTQLQTDIANKVDKVSGKGLSANDFTNNDKNKLDGIEAGAEVNPYSKTQLDNMLDDKVDKVAGMGLSSNDFTTTEKNKLSEIQAGAQVNAVTTVAGRTGAVVLAKADVGLGSLQNYAIASKAQAEAGTSNALYMTPLRTKELITVVMGDIESALDAILGV